MSNEKYDTAVVGLALAALDGAQMMIDHLRKDRECVTAELAAARLEIESLQGRVNECGAGAGCCAQAARIEALEAQLEAGGAGGVRPLTDEQIEALPVWSHFVGLWPESRKEIVRAIEAAHDIAAQQGGAA